MSIINCNAPLEIDIPGCVQTITLDLAIEATPTRVEYQFQNGFKLITTITTDISGVITLTKDSPLEGFWNEESGPVVVQFYTISKCEPDAFTLCGINYTQLVLNFKPIQTDATTFDINCTCTE
jgi:hypothetical protein